MLSNKELVWSRIGSEIKNLVEKLAGSKGVSLSEYIRELILEDLDHRSIFTTRLKEQTRAPAPACPESTEGNAR